MYGVTTLLLILSDGGGDAFAEDVNCSLDTDAMDGQVAPAWVMSGGGAVLEMSLPANSSFVLSFRARFGPAEWVWTEEGIVAVAETIQWSPLVPMDAFLHPLALDYVTDLALTIRVADDLGQTLHVAAPHAFLAWPDGPSGTAVVWDAETAASLAPQGVINEALRVHPDAERVMPPLETSGEILSIPGEVVDLTGGAQ